MAQPSHCFPSCLTFPNCNVITCHTPACWKPSAKGSTVVLPIIALRKGKRKTCCWLKWHSTGYDRSAPSMDQPHTHIYAQRLMGLFHQHLLSSAQLSLMYAAVVSSASMLTFENWCGVLMMRYSFFLYLQNKHSF